MNNYDKYTTDELKEQLNELNKQQEELLRALSKRQSDKKKSLWKDVIAAINAYVDFSGPIIVNGDDDTVIDTLELDFDLMGYIYTSEE